MSHLRRVCVFTGSSSGAHPAYREAAEAFALAAHAAGLGIVYGGASVGLMGVLADTALEAGTEVIGVIPQTLVDREIAHPGLSDLHVVDSMHERKARMAELADAFVALPGGAGTLEELFEVYTWSQLGLHAKPCALLNVRGYYDGLAGFRDHAVAEGFLRPELRATLLMGSDPAALLAELAGWEPTTLSRWATGARG